MLASNSHPVLTPVPSSTTYPAGDVVSDFLGGIITDVDVGDPQGIAITGVSGNGTWYFYTLGGWWSGTTSDQFAVILLPTDKVAFVPNSGATGTATFTFRASGPDHWIAAKQ